MPRTCRDQFVGNQLWVSGGVSYGMDTGYEMTFDTLKMSENVNA